MKTSDPSLANATSAVRSPLPAATATPDAAPSDDASYTHQTAPTLFIDAGGTRLAYRRFGPHGGVPLVFFQHFAGNLDNWDPMITDGFAHGREVILFDNAGVASSGGEVPTTIEGMATHAINLIEALGVAQADLLGFSTGSLIAQEVTLARPDLVRRLVLVGSAPRGGVGMATLTPEFQAMVNKKREVKDEFLIDSLFSSSAASQAAGREFLARVRARSVNRDSEVNEKVAPAQTAALAAWGVPHPGSDAYLKAIKQPVLLAEGSNDVIFYTVNAFNLQQHLPNAQLIIYPDSGHAPQYKYPELFLNHVSIFLNQPA